MRRGFRPRWSADVKKIASMGAGTVTDTDGTTWVTKRVHPVPRTAQTVDIDPTLYRDRRMEGAAPEPAPAPEPEPAPPAPVIPKPKPKKDFAAIRAVYGRGPPK